MKIQMHNSTEGTAGRKVVLVTGASRGIGRETAIAFARSGYLVAMNYFKSEREAEKTRAEIIKAGGEAELFLADVSKPAECVSLVKAAAASWGRIDVLVNNAAVSNSRSIFKVSEEDWAESLGTDLTGPFFVMKEAAKVMMKNDGGAVINISSVMALKGQAGSVPYTSAKAGLLGLTRSAAKELGRFHIRVNAVFPGFHLTDMGMAASEAYREKAVAESVLGRTTDIRELSAFIVFLAGAESVSGQVFNFDSRMI